MSPAATQDGENGAGPPPTGHTETPPSGGYSTFSSLRIRNFRYLWLGQISHASALWMEQVARPFLVLHITDDSALHLGGVIAARTLPQLLFGLWAGVVSDWFNRRTVLLLDKSGVLALNIAFAALVVSGLIELWHIYVFSFLRGSMMAFDQPARQALIPAVVPRERVTNAVALMSASQNTMRIVGTSLGGFAVWALGFGGTFMLIAAIYTGAVFATYMLRVPPHQRPVETGARAMARGLVEGARFAVNHPAIRGVLILSLVYFTFGMSYMQVFAPLFSKEVLGIGERGFGFMMSLTGAGALVAALLIANRQPTRLGLILPSAVITFGFMLIAFSTATYLPHPAGIIVPLALLTIIGGLQTTYFALSNSMLLHAAPEAMRGRVVSLLSLDRAMVTAGAASAGLLAHTQGVQVAQITFGAVVIIGALAVLLLNRSFRGVTTRDAQPDAPPLAPARRGGAVAALVPDRDTAVAATANGRTDAPAELERSASGNPRGRNYMGNGQPRPVHDYMQSNGDSATVADRGNGRQPRLDHVAEDLEQARN